MGGAVFGASSYLEAAGALIDFINGCPFFAGFREKQKGC